MKNFALLFALVGAAESYVLPPRNSEDITRLIARDTDPADFSWIKRWAAVGDSFTAGIGSGTPLGSYMDDQPGDDTWYCARYDTSYPEIINHALGPSVDNFQFLACSGDRTAGIYNQINALQGDLDLVVLTAGGNDLCLSGMIEKCVFLPFSGEEACQSVIDIAQNNLETILKPNLVSLMDSLIGKVKDDGVVVFNGYAQFFNTDNDDCEKNQDWTLLNAFDNTPLTLTIARRKVFNDLVVQINNIIREVVKETSANSKYKFKIGFSNWDTWPREGVSGQFCHPSSSGQYPDPDQPDLQFFKPNTELRDPVYIPDTKKRYVGNLTELERRDGANLTDWESWQILDQRARDIQAEREMKRYTTRNNKSPNPKVDAKRRLQARFPSRPNCPGDKDVDVQPPSIGLPNSIAKNFHPNELGHYTIASWVLQTIIDLRADHLGLDSPSCEVADKFTCWQSKGSKAYASDKRLNSNYEDFCNNVQHPIGEDGYKKTYHAGTPDEHEFKVSVVEGSEKNFDKEECKKSMDRVINSCDGNDPNNPMNWKFGGEWVRGDYTYQINIKRSNRPWPVIKAPHGHCEGWYHGVWSSYMMKGAGFSGYDYGQQTLLDEAGKCAGSISMWRFDYFDKPDKDGYEWQADFNTLIWVRGRCFGNNRVVFAIDGFTNGCGGND